MIHLASVASWGVPALLELPAAELAWWATEAVAYHNRLHAPPDEAQV